MCYSTFARIAAPVAPHQRRFGTKPQSCPQGHPSLPPPFPPEPPAPTPAALPLLGSFPFPPFFWTVDVVSLRDRGANPVEVRLIKINVRFYFFGDGDFAPDLMGAGAFPIFQRQIH
jgi:hypothetical protein